MAISFTNVLHDEATISATTYTTASFSVTAGELVLITLRGFDGDNNGSQVPDLTCSALSGITFVDEDWHYNSGTSSWRNCSIFEALGTGSSSTLAIDWNASLSGSAWIITKVSGTTDLVQGLAETDDETTATMSLTLGTLTSNTAVLAQGFCVGPASSITPGSGYTEMFDSNEGGDLRGYAEYDLTPASTTITATSSGPPQGWYWSAFEVGPEAGGGGGGSSESVGILPTGA